VQFDAVLIGHTEPQRTGVMDDGKNYKAFPATCAAGVDHVLISLDELTGGQPGEPDLYNYSFPMTQRTETLKYTPLPTKPASVLICQRILKSFSATIHFSRLPKPYWVRSRRKT
jgi:hypothetical protein